MSRLFLLFAGSGCKARVLGHIKLIVGEQINEKLEGFFRRGIRAGELREDLQILPAVFQFWGMLAGLIQLAAAKEDYIRQSMGLSRTQFLESGFALLYHSIQKTEVSR